ncbi:hypothetical protein [Candidatus Arsenophonus triatominarum]|uniref:hypothetical protein n=1 Tax=Candidatus Arsenophonus triatominarum TaxID=57911 RepID=UPI00164FC5BA|nr:hypothetical protein [Candidatus Arsenophonus triatominarum]
MAKFSMPLHAEIVEHCTVLSAELSDDEKIQLREKMKASKKRLIPPNKDSEVWMARLANGSNAWRFPDGESSTDFLRRTKTPKRRAQCSKNGRNTDLVRVIKAKMPLRR